MDTGKPTPKIASNMVQESLHFRYLKFLVILLKMGSFSSSRIPMGSRPPGWWILPVSAACLHRRSVLESHKAVVRWNLSVLNRWLSRGMSVNIPFIWSNYSDLTRPHPKFHLISGKTRLVKYYNLARFMVHDTFKVAKTLGEYG